MIYPRHRTRLTAAFGLALWSAVCVFAPAAAAQESSAPVTQERTPLTPAELEELAGPIALYPDDLVSIVLPASTFPLQIVQAARYLEEHKTNPSLKPNDSWDDSVVALLNYPEVIQFMNADLDWTSELGEAAIYQQTELLDAIQSYRDRAYAAGNLRTDKHQVVTKNVETIIIEPADPKVIYVPYYEPSEVIVYRPYPVYHYYPRAYPVYYYPYPYGYSFGHGFFWGVTLAFAIDWHSHYVHVHDHHHYSHPYYGRYYHYPYYRRHTVSVGYRENIWRPRDRDDFRRRHNALPVDADRGWSETSFKKGKHRTRDDQRRRWSERNTTERASGPNTADQGRNQPGLRSREVERSRNRSTQESKTVTRRSESRTRTTTTESTMPMIERLRSQLEQRRTQSARSESRQDSTQPVRTQPNQARRQPIQARTQLSPDGTPPARSQSSQVRRQPMSTLERIRSQSPSRQPAWRDGLKQRSQASVAPRRGATVRRETAGTTSRGMRSSKEFASRSVPRPQPNWRGSVESRTRSAVSDRSGPSMRSRPNFDWRRN